MSGFPGLGGGFAQGYYIARPASVASFSPWGDEEAGQASA